MKDITPEEYTNKTFSVNTLNNVITVNNVENVQAYTILVETKIDKQNKGIEENYDDYNKSFVIPAVNEYGISVGNVTTNKNNNDESKIDLLFNNSYKLTELDTISYSIYNTYGFSQSARKAFIPTQITSGDETFYTYTLEENLSEYGKYYIELQFIKNNEVIESLTLEYVYLES